MQTWQNLFRWQIKRRNFLLCFSYLLFSQLQLRSFSQFAFQSRNFWSSSWCSLNCYLENIIRKTVLCLCPCHIVFRFIFKCFVLNVNISNSVLLLFAKKLVAHFEMYCQCVSLFKTILYISKMCIICVLPHENASLILQHVIARTAVYCRRCAANLKLVYHIHTFTHIDAEHPSPHSFQANKTKKCIQLQILNKQHILKWISSNKLIPEKVDDLACKWKLRENRVCRTLTACSLSPSRHCATQGKTSLSLQEL